MDVSTEEKTTHPSGRASRMEVGGHGWPRVDLELVQGCRGLALSPFGCEHRGG